MTNPKPSILPLPLTDDAIQRLAFIRYIFELGERQAEAPGMLASAALLLFHDSVELFLVLGTERLNVFKKGMQFLQYFEAIDKVIAPDALSERGSMVRLNDVRVSLKHYSNTSQPDVVRRSQTQTRSFLELNTVRVFGVRFEEVSLAFTVATPKAREALGLADQHRAAGELEQAIEQIAIARAWLFKSNKISTIPRHKFPVQLGYDGDERTITQYLNDHERELSEIQVNLELMRRGVSLAKLQAFRRMTPSITISMADTIQSVTAGFRLPATEESVAYCYAFVVETALTLQAQDQEIRIIAERSAGKP